MRQLVRVLFTCLVISTLAGCSVMSSHKDQPSEFAGDLTSSFSKQPGVGAESNAPKFAQPGQFENPAESNFDALGKGNKFASTSLRFQSLDLLTDPSSSSTTQAMGKAITFESLPSIGLESDSFVHYPNDIYDSRSYDNFEFPTDQVENDFSIKGIFAEFVSDTKSDFKNFYTAGNGAQALAFLGAGAWLANSNLDQNILQHIQEDITFNNNSSEYQQFVGEFRFFGEGYFLLPIYFSAGILGKHVFSDRPKLLRIGHWGDRCFRGIVLGTPPLILSQHILGASRPGETNEGSEWQFLADNNGVSGHAFMGAIPFLTAFHMTKNRKLKVLYFAASTLPAFSRITENGHYPSQALLGWGLAYLITGSVAKTELQDDRISLAPYMSTDAVGIGLTFRR